MRKVVLSLLLASVGACSSNAADPPPSDAAAVTDAAATDVASADAGVGAAVRGLRYCEVLLVTIPGAMAHVDVYTTFGLNDCPQAAWASADAAAIATAQGVTRAILNGPRYWTLDRFVAGSLIDPTPRTLGGLAMRHAGSIDLALATLSALGTAPYTPRTIQRNSTVQFDAGQRVYELVGPDGATYDMQSYSTQTTAQTEADLATLGARLTLPMGWRFQARTLTAPLQIRAVDGLATVIQDDFANTYQRSQQ